MKMQFLFATCITVFEHGLEFGSYVQFCLQREHVSDSSFFVFRPSSCAAVSSPAAAVAAAAVSAVGSVKLQKRKNILSILTLRTSRTRMQVRDFVLWVFLYRS